MEIIRGKISGPKKVVIYGPEGIGKSSLASQFPNPVFDDTEGSTVELDVQRTPKSTSWAMLLEHVKYFIANPHLLKTYVIDTADWAEKLCIKDVCSKAQKDGIEGFGYGKGYVYVGEEFGRLLNLLDDLIAKGVNVVFTAHAWMRKFEQPDELGAYDRWEMKLTKFVGPMLREWADMVLFANYETYVVNVDGQGAAKGKNKAQGGKRVMYTSHHPCWDAKNRQGLPDKVDLDFKAIAHCIPAEANPVTSSPSSSQVSASAPAPASAPSPATTPPPSPPPAPPVSTPPAAPKHEPPKDDLSRIPKPLADLMKANNVTVKDIQKAVAKRGYYPLDTPIENYDPDFISGVLVGAWPQVFQLIKSFKDEVPF